MSTVTDIFRARWASGMHVGEAAPAQAVMIRTGHFDRDYFSWPGPDVDAFIPKSNAGRPWRARWRPTSDWVCLPNILQVELDHNFEQKGIQTCTVQLEDVLWREQAGPFGQIYHWIDRGALAPFRGYAAPGRPFLTCSDEWFMLLANACQIKVWQGYGTAIVPTMTGLIDDVDWTSSPDRITITVRDFGQMLTDQALFGNVKDPACFDPVTFAQKKVRTDLKVGHGAVAKSQLSGHPPRFVLDASASSWISQSHDGPGYTEWCEIHLPQGPFERFFLNPLYTGHEMYVSIYAKAPKVPGTRNTVQAPQMDGQEISEGWVHLPGHGIVDGVPTIKRWPTINNRGKPYALDHNFYLGTDSILRVSLRNLWPVGALPGTEHPVGGGSIPTTAGIPPNAKYRAGISDLHGLKRQKPVYSAAEQRYIFVGDLSDIVKVCLRWCGFEEWDIESVGAAVKGKWVFNRSDHPMDVIQKVLDATGYVFYIDAPTDEDRSLGIPVFRSNSAIKDLPDVGTVRDTDLLTAIQTKLTDEAMATRIWVRGKVVKKGGVTFHGDRSKRILGWYQPPWGARLAGIIKDFVHYDDHITTVGEARLFAMLIALQEALASTLCSIEIPGTPEFSLDDQIGLLDTGTGLNTRAYVATRNTVFTSGKTTSFKTTLGGALIDTPDITQLIADMKAELARQGKTWTGVLELGDPSNQKAA